MSNAVGAITATAFAYFGVHEITSADPNYVKFLAEVVGSGAGGIGGAYLNDIVLSLHFSGLRNRRLLRLLKSKLISDFKHSFLDRPGTLFEALKSSNSILNAANLLAPADELNFEGLLAVPAEPLAPQDRSDFERTLINSKHIKVNCAALFPASLSILLSLKERLRDHLQLEVDCSDENSHKQFERVSRGDYFDFVIAAEGPFFLVRNGIDNPGAIEAKGLSNYARIFPCNIEWQHAFLRKGGEQVQAVYVFQASSAELQYKTNFSRLYPHAEQIKLSRGDQVALLGEKHLVNPGECVIVWEPLSQLFENNSNFVKLPDGKFRVWISLFCRKEWMRPSRRKTREAFRQLFIDEWRRLNSHEGHDRAFRLLQNSETIVNNFALCSGFRRDDRLGSELEESH